MRLPKPKQAKEFIVGEFTVRVRRDGTVVSAWAYRNNARRGVANLNYLLGNCLSQAQIDSGDFDDSTDWEFKSVSTATKAYRAACRCATKDSARFAKAIAEDWSEPNGK